MKLFTIIQGDKYSHLFFSTANIFSLYIDAASVAIVKLSNSVTKHILDCEQYFIGEFAGSQIC